VFVFVFGRFAMEKAPAQTFLQLTVWQKSHELVLQVYKLTGSFPREELFGLTSQMRRAAVSVPANIAEAFKKRSKSDKVRILNISQGSLEELRYYFVLAADLSYLPQAAAAKDLEQVARLLGGYIGRIAESNR
jgi:four helix bundle protein